MLGWFVMTVNQPEITQQVSAQPAARGRSNADLAPCFHPQGANFSHWITSMSGKGDRTGTDRLFQADWLVAPAAFDGGGKQGRKTRLTRLSLSSVCPAEPVCRLT